MPRAAKSKLTPPQLEFINPPYSKIKGDLNYKVCSELYPEVKKAHPEEVFHWFDPSFKIVSHDNFFKLKRSNSVSEVLSKKLEFIDQNNCLQKLEAPKPRVVSCTRPLDSRPIQYGIEYHGSISREETERLLDNACDGSYLIRDSQRAKNTYTLVIWFDKTAKNFKLYYNADSKKHYVGETKFDTVEMLVADGLIHFYVETRGSDVLQKIAEANTYEKTPFYKTRYHTLNVKSLEAPFETKCCNQTVLDDDRFLPFSNQKQAVNNQVSIKRRQSIDVSLLSEKLKSLSPRLGPLSSDGPMFSDQNSIKFKNHPPRTSLTFRSNYCYDSLNTISVSGSALLFPKHDTISNSTPKQPKYNWLLKTNNSKESDPIVFASSKPDVALFSNDVFIPHDCRVNHNYSTNSSRSNLTNSFYNDVRRSSSSTLNRSLDDRDLDDSPDKSGMSHAPLATCYSGESSSSIESTASSCTRSSTTTQPSGDSLLKPVGSDGWRSKTDDDAVVVVVNGRDDGRTKAMVKLQERYNLPAVCLPSGPHGPNGALIADVKMHHFKVHTYIGPHWCDYCTHFIWGLVAQGMRCADCGFQAHKRCADRVPLDCIPDIKKMQRVFGVDLTNLTRAENKPVPTLLVKCVEEIERRGALVSEGIYRVPGNHDLIEELRSEFDKDPELANISKSHISDTNTLTSLIKFFLRQLPVPLITYEVYPELIQLVQNEHLGEDEKLDALRTVLHRLPPAHFQTLRFFILHIHRVTQHRESNMMTASNLAIILAPTLMSSSYTDPMSCLVGTRYEHALVSLLITHCNDLFDAFDSSSTGASRAAVDAEDIVVDHQQHRHSLVVTTTPNSNGGGSGGGMIRNAFEPTCPVPQLQPSLQKKWRFRRSKIVAPTTPTTPSARTGSKPVVPVSPV